MPLFRMAHLSADGASWLATCLMNPGKPITERSDLGQTFKILQILVGITEENSWTHFETGQDNSQHSQL